MEIENKKLVIGLILVFLLGVLFAIVNGQYTDSTNHNANPSNKYATSRRRLHWWKWRVPGTNLKGWRNSCCIFYPITYPPSQRKL